MATYSSRMGLIKPAGSEPRAVGPITQSFDLLDKFMPCILVNDGVTPPTGDLYDGALVKERTSGIIWEARKNGGGTFDKVYVQYPCYFNARTLNQSTATGTIYSAIGYASFQSGKNASAANITSGQFVVPVKGIWSINLKMNFAANAAGQRGSVLRYNSAMLISDPDWEVLAVASGWGNAFDTQVIVSGKKLLNAGDTLAGGVWQNSGGNLNITHSGTFSLDQATQ